MPPVAASSERGHQGLATGDPDTLRHRVLSAWDAFLELAQAADLDAPSRLPGWRGHEVVAHVGAWESAPLSRIVANARAGGRGPLPRPDRDNDRLVVRHRDASTTEVLAAARRARNSVAEFLDSPDAEELGLTLTQSAVSHLPVLTLVNAAAYELAVHALDLEPCGAPPPPDDLLQAGVGALADVTGALAARTGRSTAFTIQTPDGGWRGVAEDSGWDTMALAAGRVTGTAVLGTAADVLDASAGRVVVLSLLATRRLRLQNVPGLLALAPIVTDVPGIPGGQALKVAARALGGVGGLLGRVPRLPGS